jgi:hypothetical protein
MSDYAATIQSRFSESGCTTEGLDDGMFEFTHKLFPAKTHTFPNEYFLQLTTFIYAKPKGLLGRMRFKRDDFLNRANQKTNLMKVTCDEQKFDLVWSCQCQAKITSGTVASEFSVEAIDHLVKLWLQDLAYVVQTNDVFEITAMIRESDS